MNHTFSLFITESCCLEHDKNKYRVITGLHVPHIDFKDLKKKIKETINKHSLQKDLKWQHLVNYNYEAYKEIIEIFLDSNMTQTGIVFHTEKLTENSFQSRCYSMYNKILKDLPERPKYNVYTHLNDKRSYRRTNLLRKNKFNVQNIHMHESTFMQLSSVISSSIANYFNFESRNESHKSIIKMLNLEALKLPNIFNHNTFQRIEIK